MDDLFSSDKLSVVDEIQRSLKVPDYYANINYLKMLEMNTNWTYTSSLLTNIQDNLTNVQSDMGPLQTEVLANMQTSIKTGRDEIKALYDTKKSGASDAASLKTLTSSMDPRVSQIMEETSADIPTSITLINKITGLKAQLKT
jgi:predicted transcriptional regulator